MKIKSIIGIFFILTFLNISGQDRRFDTNKLDKLKTTKTYNYDREIEESTSWIGKVFEAIVKFLETTIGSTLGYILLAVIILLILYLILRSSPGGIFGSRKKQTPSSILVEETENIQEVDLNALLSKALKDNNYRFAVRYLYLIILKDLDSRKMINWTKDKTNREYVYELQNDMLRNDLQYLTRLYEYAWYGEIPVEEHHFNQVKPDFDKFSKNIGN